MIRSGKHMLVFQLKNRSRLVAVDCGKSWAIWQIPNQFDPVAELVDCDLTKADMIDQFALLIEEDDRRHTAFMAVSEDDLILCPISETPHLDSWGN